MNWKDEQTTGLPKNWDIIFFMFDMYNASHVFCHIVNLIDPSINRFLIKVQQASIATTQSSEYDDLKLSATEFLVIDG